MAVEFGNGIDLANQKIIRLGDPSAPTDAVNKQYADALVRGLSWKVAVKAATTAHGDMLTTYVTGATIDGVVLATGDRILIKDQADGADNGIYVVAESAAPTRALDSDSADELRGATVTVTHGSVNADRVYRLVTDAVTLGTTDLVWTQVGGASIPYTAGAGLVESPTGTFNVAGGSGITVTDDAVALASTAAGAGLTHAAGVLAVGAGEGIIVEADLVKIDTSVVTRKAAANIGNGSATSVIVNHNLATRDVVVSVAYNTAPYKEIMTEVEKTDLNNVTVKFATAPSVSQFRVTVTG